MLNIRSTYYIVAPIMGVAIYDAFEQNTNDIQSIKDLQIVLNCMDSTYNFSLDQTLADFELCEFDRIQTLAPKKFAFILW